MNVRRVDTSAGLPRVEQRLRRTPRTFRVLGSPRQDRAVDLVAVQHDVASEIVVPCDRELADGLLDGRHRIGHVRRPRLRWVLRRVLVLRQIQDLFGLDASDERCPESTVRSAELVDVPILALDVGVHLILAVAFLDLRQRRNGDAGVDPDRSRLGRPRLAVVGRRCDCREVRDPPAGCAPLSNRHVVQVLRFSDSDRGRRNDGVLYACDTEARDHLTREPRRLDNRTGGRIPRHPVGDADAVGQVRIVGSHQHVATPLSSGHRAVAERVTEGHQCLPGPVVPTDSEVGAGNTEAVVRAVGAHRSGHPRNRGGVAGDRGQWALRSTGILVGSATRAARRSEQR